MGTHDPLCTAMREASAGPDVVVAKFIAAHYKPVEQIGEYVMFERN